MDWSNWVSHATQVLEFFITIASTLFNFIMASPITGVPVIVLIIGLVMTQVIKFIGAFGAKGSKED